MMRGMLTIWLGVADEEAAQRTPYGPLLLDAVTTPVMISDQRAVRLYRLCAGVDSAIVARGQ